MEIKVNSADKNKDFNASELGEDATFDRNGSDYIVIPIINDNLTESNETVTLMLRSITPWSAKVVHPEETEIKILDNDGKIIIFARKTNL